MMHTRTAVAITLGLAVFVLGGCTVSQQPETPDVYPAMKAWIDEVLTASDPTEFEKAVLADYVVTDAEEREAEDRFMQCMAENGYDVQFLDDGGYQMAPSAGNPDPNKPVSQSLDVECSKGSIDLVRFIYFEAKWNPERLSGGMLIRACFEKHGLDEGSGLSDDEFSAMVEDPSWIPATDQGALCFWDSLETGTLTPEQAMELMHNR
ncbi:MAG: hypothetical protein LBG99_09480 [Propionibacteriaceae bacterium]|jgi:hypothetical protein|nr:hypothetical protein [Propionibacteriaceae bacterium]